MNNSPLFVQHFIGFLFIEEAVQSVGWVPGQVLINRPPPPFQIFREFVKNWMGFCCFVTIKYLPLGFVKSSIGTISPGGVWGGRSPPTCRPPFFLVSGGGGGEWSKKVSSNLLNFAKLVAYGYALIATRGFRACQNSYGFRAIWSEIFCRTKIY